ncbi:calmodulin [Lingula anatina]|uniref:Calmodulin n=1 Tax=Lingula anatina TaxID=7574 RepID=A0A1S3IPI5_LINAN|nr:calmodulin [Lingula anatina]|eukprot:XP_013399983.1 calmodulin [Lingula anatina]
MPLFNLSGNQYLQISCYFNKYANNGSLGKQEIKAALSRNGIEASLDDIQGMIDAISINSTGINLQCFLDYCATYTGLRDTDAEYAEAFRVFDTTGSGSLTRDEVQYVMTKMGNKSFDCEALFKEADKNNDGTIDYEEFVAVMKQKF